MERLDLNGRRSGKMKTHCPLCRDGRKNKRDRSVSVDIDKGIAFCHYCGASFQKDKKKDAALPYPVHSYPATATSASVERFLFDRKISRETQTKMRVRTAEEWMPQTGRKTWCVCFDYYEEGRLVNTKYRDLEKNFRMTAKAEVIPYNIDGIKGTEECIITEGEIDALSFAEIGRPEVISVPTGANKNLAWLDRFVKTHLDDKRMVYVAVDADRKGKELGAVLTRRLGAARCRTLIYPEGCKDANEVLMHLGSEALLQVLTEAAERPLAPLEGVLTAKDVGTDLRKLFEKGMERGAGTGWENFDRYCTFETGRLLVITGIPGVGKSEFLDELIIRLNLSHGWKTAYFSPENHPLTYHLRKLMEKAMGERFKEDCMTGENYVNGEAYLTKNYSFIYPKENFTVENLLSTAEELVARQGIKILSIDPFNRFEHQIPAGQTEAQYISTVLDRFTNFAIRNDCLVIIVAHPRKMYKQPGALREPVPELYDINGSAAFCNKCDIGLTVERDYTAGATRIHIQKVKFRHLGQRGEALFMYNTTNGCYVPCEIDEQTGKAWKATFDNTPFFNTTTL